MFIPEAEKVLPKGWDAYSSGGGCYHAMKEFETLKGTLVAVEVHWSGGAQMYHANDSNRLVASKELEDDNCWCNYVELAWINERFDDENNFVFNYSDYEFTDYLNIFPSEAQKEILLAMMDFTKSYDEYHY